MQPHAQAARDRITAYLDGRQHILGDRDQIAEAKNGGSPWAYLTVTDLRTVLAALDRQPDRVLIIPDHLSEHAAQIIRERLADEWGALPADPKTSDE